MPHRDTLVMIEWRTERLSGGLRDSIYTRNAETQFGGSCQKRREGGQMTFSRDAPKHLPSHFSQSTVSAVSLSHEIGRPLWLSWPIAYGRCGAMWVLSLKHKNSMGFSDMLSWDAHSWNPATVLWAYPHMGMELRSWSTSSAELPADSQHQLASHLGSGFSSPQPGYSSWRLVE